MLQDTVLASVDNQRKQRSYFKSIGFTSLIIVPFSDPYNERPNASILKLLKEGTRHFCCNSAPGNLVFTCEKTLCIQYLMSTSDLKTVPFLVNHNPEFMAFTAEDESNQRNRMRINGLVLHCSSAFLHSFSDHSLIFLTFLTVQLGKYLHFFCQSTL